LDLSNVLSTIDFFNAEFDYPINELLSLENPYLEDALELGVSIFFLDDGVFTFDYLLVSSLYFLIIYPPILLRNDV
jgi:hypothetical protein